MKKAVIALQSFIYGDIQKDMLDIDISKWWRDLL